MFVYFTPLSTSFIGNFEQAKLAPIIKRKLKDVYNIASLILLSLWEKMFFLYAEERVGVN